MADRIDRDILVIGGGISGLTAAWRLHKAGKDVALLEASARAGGCTRTEARDGFLLEKGPFNVIVRDPSFEDLLEDFSPQLAIVSASPEARRRYIYQGGKLVAVPSSPVQLLRTPLLSVRGRLRLIRGLLVSSKPRSKEETIEQVATRRFGREVSDSIVSAGISGILAGDIRKLSLAACFPSVGEIDKKTRSPLGYGLTAVLRRKFGTGQQRAGKCERRRWRGLISMEGGLGALTHAMGKSLGDRLHASTTAESFERFDGGFEVRCRTTGDASSDGSLVLRCKRLVIASPAAETARLLRRHLPDATKELLSIENASLAVLNLGYRKTDVGHPMQGFGFLVPHNEPGFPLMGVLWADTVFPHLAPPDRRLIRVFMGGARDPGVVSKSDRELAATAHSALRDLLSLRGEPMLVDVTRHNAAIPQYHLGYAEKVRRIRRSLAPIANLHLIGNYLEGVSLNDCVRLATAKANELIEENGTDRPPLVDGVSAVIHAVCI